MMITKKFKFVFFGLLLLTMFMAAQPVSAARSLEVTSTAFDNMSITVTAKGLIVGVIYNISTSPDAGTTYTEEVAFTASETSHTFYFSVATPSTKILYVSLGNDTAAATWEATANVYFPDDDDVINSDALVDFIITIVVIVLPVLIVRRLMRGF